MSSSDWSDMDLNVDLIEEDASVRIVKSSNALQVLSAISSQEKPYKDLNINNSDQELRLSTSQSPLPSEKDEKSLVIFKVDTKIVDIFDDKSSPTKKNDINERCFKFKEKVRAKIEKMTKDQEDDEKKHCPFRPQLLSNTKNSRNFQEFLNEMKKFDRGKDKKLVFLRNKKIIESPANRPPAICKNSEKIMKKTIHPQQVHQKLYEQGRILKKKPSKNEVLSFSPTVNQKSHDLKRQMTVDQILYNDAIRRNNKSNQSPSFIKEKFINPSSEQVLTEKFRKDFRKTLEFLYPQDKVSWNFTEFLTILCELRFIHNDIDDKFYEFEKEMVLKAWNQVQVDCESTKERILEFLLAVLNYEHSTADSKTKAIHREFISFYECRHWFVLNQKRRRQQRDMTFTPSLFSGYSYSPSDVFRKSHFEEFKNENKGLKGWKKFQVKNDLGVVENRKSASIVELLNQEINIENWKY
jgi:hypothetical protein